MSGNNANHYPAKTKLQLQAAPPSLDVHHLWAPVPVAKQLPTTTKFRGSLLTPSN